VCDPIAGLGMPDEERQGNMKRRLRWVIIFLAYDEANRKKQLLLASNIYFTQM